MSLDPQYQCKIFTEEHKSAIPAMVGQTALNPGGWLASQAPKPSGLWESQSKKCTADVHLAAKEGEIQKWFFFFYFPVLGGRVSL